MKKTLLITALFSLLCVSACTQKTSPEPSAPPSPSASAAVTQSPSPSPSSEPENVIKASTESKIGKDWSKVAGCGYDIDNDGTKENISLSTSAKTEDGEIMWDDSQQWVLEVSNGIDTYTLFDKNVSGGSVYMDFSELYEGDEIIPMLSLVRTSSAGLSVTTYKYSADLSGFIEENVLDSSTLASGGANSMYSSFPDIE